MTPLFLAIIPKSFLTIQHLNFARSNATMVHRMLCLAVLVFYSLVSCQAYTASEIYGSLTDEDKGHFLRYYIAKGFFDSQTVDSAIYPGIQFPQDLPIPEDVAQTFENMNIEPEDFPVKLLNDFAKKYNLTPSEALQVARKRCNCVPKDKYLCLPNGKCVDLGDVGSVCCT